MITKQVFYPIMVKVFRESHEKDVERLTVDRRRETESKEVHTLKKAPNHVVLCMKGLTTDRMVTCKGIRSGHLSLV